MEIVILRISLIALNFSATRRASSVKLLRVTKIFEIISTAELLLVVRDTVVRALFEIFQQRIRVSTFIFRSVDSRRMAAKYAYVARSM